MTLVLIAHIAGHCVAFDTASIESVVDVGAIVPTPRAHPTVLGLTALRSRVVTVIDAGAALGIAGERAGVRRAVVAEIDGHFYAFAVDALEDVIDHPVLPLTAGMALAGGWARAAKSYIERGDEAVLLIDVAALIPTGSASLDRAA